MKHNTMLTIASLLSSSCLTLSHYGRHRPWDIQGRELKHCAAHPRGLTVRDASAPRTVIGARHHAARRIVRGSHARHPHEGAHYGEIAKFPGGFFFVWTLWALGGLGGFTFILSARGLWRLRPGQPHQFRTTDGGDAPRWMLKSNDQRRSVYREANRFEAATGYE